MTVHASLFGGTGQIMNKCNDEINKYSGTVIVDNEFLDQSCKECVAGSDIDLSVTTPTSGVFDEFISLLPATAPYTIVPIDISDWCQYDIATDGMRVYGTSVTGTAKQIFSITNDCDEFHVVVEITTPSACIAPSNITKNVTSNKGSLSAQVTLLAGSTLVSSVVPDGISVQVLGDILYLNGTITTENTYSIELSTPCGNYTVSGIIKICKQITLLSTSGTTEFEKGTVAGFTWNVDSDVEIESVANLPNGLSVSASNKSVIISGTPSENTGNGTISVKVKNPCSNLELKAKFTQAPCKVITVTGDVGSNILKVDVAGEFGKVLGGKTPIELIGYTDIPKGMTVSLVNNSGVYSIVISGTPVYDPCAANDTGNICSSALVTVSNECGEKEISIPYGIATQTVPAYCIGIYSWIAPTLTVWGVTANSTITITGASESSLTVNSFGSGSITMTANDPLVCPTISHPTCALVRSGATSIC